jgi:hypothetical protein
MIARSARGGITDDGQTIGRPVRGPKVVGKIKECLPASLDSSRGLPGTLKVSSGEAS